MNYNNLKEVDLRGWNGHLKKSYTFFKINICKTPYCDTFQSKVKLILDFHCDEFEI